jgi:hypothetical protein
MYQITYIKAENHTGATIFAGSAVYLDGYDSVTGFALIAPASCDNAGKMPAIGVVAYNIPVSSNVINVISIGNVVEMDTYGEAAGTDAYVGIDGAIVFEDPALTNPSYITQWIGTVSVSAHYPNGVVEVLIGASPIPTATPIIPLFET